MSIYNLIAQNRELFRIFYSLIIVIICLIIVIKTNRLFRLSEHQGIRYFRNAFLFYGAAFISRYFLWFFFYPLAKIGFEFFLIMAGFFLLYSLLWKRIETKPSDSSLFNARIFIFYILALVIATLDYLWSSYYFIFFSQIIVFIFISSISYVNYKKSKKKSFLKLYFIAMLMSLIAWILNFIAASFFAWRLRWVVGVYILNVIVFFLFLYGVFSVTKKPIRGE